MNFIEDLRWRGMIHDITPGTEEQLKKELDNRKIILKWMIQKDIRDYQEVGEIVSNYMKNSDELLKKAREEIKH